MKIKTSGKIAILLVVIGAVFGLYKLFGENLSTMLPGQAPRESIVPGKINLPTGPNGSRGPVTTGAGIPGTTLANVDGPEIRYLHWAWNAQMGAMFANGGRETTEGSIMEKRGVNLKFTRQDDVSKMQEALVAFATQLKNGQKQPSNGAHFVAIMGDGAPQFLTSINETLKKLGPAYKAKVIGCIGYSRGEDKFMGPEAWKTNPSASKGGVVSGYLRDGDWNIAMKWLGDNGLKNNPDERTYDPDALNWINANDYLDACQKYISGYTEERAEVRNGKRTGRKVKIKVDAVVTWTPGDVQIAQEKGGLVSIVSTKEYNYQMPCTIIGIDKWMKDNRPLVENMLGGFYEGGEAIKAGGNFFKRGSEIVADVFGEKDADAEYWAKYFNVVVEKDKQGLKVELGGSSVNDLTDGLITFGLVQGGDNLFAATYQAFGDILVQQYPELFPRYDPVGEILDTSYVKNLMAQNKGAAAPALAKERIDAPDAPSVGAKKISTSRQNIAFATGKATFAPLAGPTLEKLKRQLVIAGNTTIEIHGHTDNVGSPESNMALSEARAFAVKNWLEKKFPLNFPQGRVQVFSHGQTNPVAANTSEAGRSKNRRVEIVIRAAN